MRRITALALLVLLAVGGTALAVEDPSTARGFSPEKVYDFGQLDDINLFNGNLTITIPIGPRFALGPQLGYALTLAYNSKVWDVVEDGSPFGYCGSPQGLSAVPHFTNNAGMGWSLGFGRLFPTADATANGVFLFESPDGGSHPFERTIQAHTQGNLTSPRVSLTTDNTHLRLTVTAWQAASPFDKPTAATVELPGGTRYEYTADTSGNPYADWQLSTIRDRFGNTVTASWNATTLTQTLTDPLGRQSSIEYQSVRSRTPVYKRIIKSVTVPAFGAGTSVYAFSYTWVRVINPVTFNECDPHYLDDIPLLTSITLPGSSTFSMSHPSSQSINFGLVYDPSLATLTFPTGGQLAYTYGPYTLPRRTCSPSNGGQNGVATRTYVDPFGNSQQWSYSQELGDRSYSTLQCNYDSTTPGDGLEEPYDLSTTTVTTPSGIKEVHYFSVFQGGGPLNPSPDTSPHGFSINEYGLSLNHFVTAVGSELLATEVYDCSSATCPSTPTRATYVQYEDHGTGGSSYVDVLPKASRTFFYDDPVGDGAVRYTDAVSSDYDGYGHFRQTTTGGNFISGNVRTSFTNYNPGSNSSGLVNGSDPFAGKPWIIGTYSEQWVNEAGHTAASESLFDADTGFLLRRRVLRVDGGSAANVIRDSHDVLAVFTADGYGNAARQQLFGGDTCGSATLLDSCGHAPSCPSADALGSASLLPAHPYAAEDRRHTYGYGVLATSQSYQCDGTAMPFFERNLTIDPTGAVAASRDTDELSTSYAYDGLGRVTEIDPPGPAGGYTHIVYNPAVMTGTVTPARVIVTRGTTRTDYQYDGLGRLWKEKRQMPGIDVWALREITYDTAGRVLTQSGFEDTTTGFNLVPSYRTHFAYDVFDRPTTVTTPDGHATSFAYAGISGSTRTVSVATGASETVVTTSETYDGQRRLVAVVDAAGSPEAMTAAYGYDVGGRLASVTMGSQQRLFTYDQRGYLTSEQHPELGVGGNGSVIYSDYDARGLPGRRTYNGGADLRMTYDAAGRLLKISDLTAFDDDDLPRSLKLFVYDSGSQCAGSTCHGKLSQAARLHYFGPDLGTIPVSESYQYSPVHGRPIRHDLTVGSNSTFTGASFYLTQSYDDLGNVATMTYPCRGSASPCEDSAHTPRTVNYTYTNGLLTAVSPWASAITYQPNGLLASVTHGSGSNATTETWSADPVQMSRPASITATSAGGTTLWSSGAYAYDGAGNIKSVGATSYHYDRLNRLASWTTAIPGGSNSTAVAYDPYGNQLYSAYSFCGTGSDNVQRCGQTGVYAMSIAGTTNHYAGMTYDAAGSVVNDGNRVFTYDPLNTTIRTQASGHDYRFLYTVDDERIAAVELLPGNGQQTTFTLRGFDNHLLSQWTNGQWKEDDIWRGAALLATETPAGTTHHHLDHLGSPASRPTPSAPWSPPPSTAPSAPAARKRAARCSSQGTSGTRPTSQVVRRICPTTCTQGSMRRIGEDFCQSIENKDDLNSRRHGIATLTR